MRRRRGQAAGCCASPPRLSELRRRGHERCPPKRRAAVRRSTYRPLPVRRRERGTTQPGPREQQPHDLATVTTRRPGCAGCQQRIILPGSTGRWAHGRRRFEDSAVFGLPPGPVSGRPPQCRRLPCQDAVGGANSRIIGGPSPRSSGYARKWVLRRILVGSTGAIAAAGYLGGIVPSRCSWLCSPCRPGGVWELTRVCRCLSSRRGW